MIDREKLLQENEIVAFIEDRGGELKQSGSQHTTNYCPITMHKPGHQCVNVDPEKQVWFCNDCGKGGSVIDWVMHEQSMTDIQAMEFLAGDGGGEARRDGGAPSALTALTGQAPKEVAVYNHVNENGQLLYQVVRYEPKTFRQRQPKGSDWVWNLEGITRVLYNLPNVLLSKTVCVTEGEKDADNLNDLGLAATTNAGGSKNWLEAYADVLKNKDVVIFEDNDRAGKDWGDKVISSCRDKAASIKRIRFPGHKDVSDWLWGLREAGKTPEEINEALQGLIDQTPHVVSPLPIYTIQEMEEQFAANVNDPKKRGFSMSAFSSQFKNINDNLTPGEVVMIVGDTSMGKTAFMQAIAMSAKPLQCLMFELELPLDTMFARYVQMQRKCYERDIYRGYKENPKGRYADSFDRLQHIMVCPESGLTMGDVERYTIKSELKFGDRPTLVFVDYMGLVGQEYGRSGYEIMAYNANQSKVVAKRTNTIFVVGSQVSRPPGSKEHIKDVKIHHAKGAGELENTANLVLGISRPEDKLLEMTVLKNTRGPIGAKLMFDFEPGTLQITERAAA